MTLERMLKAFTDISKEDRQKVMDNTTKQEKRDDNTNTTRSGCIC